MSVSALRQRNCGCYTTPFSGVGVEFFPLSMMPDQSGILLHEAGSLARNDWWNYPKTLSPFWRLYFNGRPGHKVIFPSAEPPLTPEHVILIPDHQLFHSVGRGPVPHTWMTFQVAGRLDSRQALPILLRPTATERQLLRELARQFTGIGIGHRERILHVSLALLHVQVSRRELHWQAGAPAEGLQRALRQLEIQHAKALNLGEVARQPGLSGRGFANAFKKAQGGTPGRFPAHVRVREATNLLANTGESLEEIAAQTGFPNRHSLSRVFKQVTGDSPAHFRLQHGVKPEV